MADREQVERSLLNTSVSDLRTLVKEHKLSVQGTKKQLVNRLLDHNPRATSTPAMYLTQHAGGEDEIVGKSADLLKEVPRIFTDLPKDNILNILVQLELFDLLKMCQTDKKINKLCTNEVWKQKALRDFPIYSSVDISITDWKNEYLQRVGDMTGYAKWMRLQPDIDDQIIAEMNRHGRSEILVTDPMYNDLLDLMRSLLIEDEENEYDVARFLLSPNGSKALACVGYKIAFIDITNKLVLCRPDNADYYVEIINNTIHPDHVEWSVDANAFLIYDSEFGNMIYFRLNSSCVEQNIFNQPHDVDLEFESRGSKYRLSSDGTKIARLFYDRDLFSNRDFKSDPSIKILKVTEQTHYKKYTISTNKPLGRLFIYDTEDHTDQEIPYIGIYDVDSDDNNVSANKNWFMYIDWNAPPINANDNGVTYYNIYDDNQYTSLPTDNGKYYKVTKNNGVRVTQYIAVQNGAIVRSEYR